MFINTQIHTHIFICTYEFLLILSFYPKLFSLRGTCHYFAVFIHIAWVLQLKSDLWLCASFSRKNFPSPHIPFPSDTYSFSSGSMSFPIRQCGSLLGCIWAQTRPFVELLYSYLPNYRIQSRMSELITCIYCLQGLGKRNAVVHLTVAHKLSHLPSSSIFALWLHSSKNGRCTLLTSE